MLSLKQFQVAAMAPELTPAVAGGKLGSEEAKIPLLTPYQLGPFSLQMRVVYPPLTRNRALGTVTQPNAAVYYSQRAHPGQLLIAEGTVVSAEGHGYPNTPGIYTEEQVEAWKPVVKAVKDKGATFFCQLWHVGRASHPAFMPDGESLPLAPSPIRMSDAVDIFTPSFQAVKPVVPKEMTKEDIKRVVQEFRQAARAAIDAGFDGVEIHGATGYLVNQFINDGPNQRSDEYGGSIENRARFVLEIVDALVDEVGKDQVGLRLSPYDDFLESTDSDPVTTYKYIAEEVNKRGILYLHMVEARGMADKPISETEGKSLEPFRKAWNGSFIAAGGYKRDSGNEAVASGHADLIAFGRWHLANPDLPERFAKDAKLNKYDRSTFYIPDQVKGYIDYPFLE